MQRQKANILYVDDEGHNLISFKAAFRRDYNIFTANSAPEGLKILGEEPIHIIITDQKMPGTTGVEFLEQVVERYPHTIRMILTGFSDIEAIIQAINSGGIYRYITKPWDENELKMTFSGAHKLYLAEENNRLLFKQLQDKVHEQEFIIEERTKDIHKQKQFLELQNQIISRKNKDLLDSIKYAKRIQEAILPSEAFMKSILPESFVYYVPKDIVSGDFYWMEKQGEDIFLAVVDCTGHGVPGAFMSILGYTLLNDSIRLGSPELMLNAMNTGLHKALHNKDEDKYIKDGMEISLLKINSSSRLLEFAGANTRLYIIRDNSFIEIEGDKEALCAFYGNEEKHYNNYHFQLKPGDMLYAFSDGYVDQFGGKNNKKFMSKRFKDLLLQIYTCSMGEQRNIIETTIMNWRGDHEQVDDILVVGLKID